MPTYTHCAPIHPTTFLPNTHTCHHSPLPDSKGYSLCLVKGPSN